MENVKNFNQFINEELSPDAYKRARYAGGIRNDIRGDRIKQTADDLLHKNHPQHGYFMEYHTLNGDVTKCRILNSLIRSNGSAATLMVRNDDFGEYLIECDFSADEGTSYYCTKGNDVKIFFDRKNIEVLYNFLKSRYKHKLSINKKQFPMI